MKTFKELKRKWAEEEAYDIMLDSYDAKEFIVSVLSNYYLKQMPNNKKEFGEWLINEKGYSEEDVEYYLEEVEDNE